MTFMEFESHEEMVDYLRKASEAAFEAITPQQEALTYGSYWVQFHDIANRQVVFGRVKTLDETRDIIIGNGGTTAEVNAELKDIEAGLANGYMFGIAHSGWYPEGELGDTHKSVAWPIPKELFEAAAKVQFQIDLLPLTHKVTLEAAYQAYRERKVA
jgi:hypothetical protein